MTGKESFISQIDEMIVTGHLELAADAEEFYQSLKATKAPAELTEKGIAILSFMQENAAATYTAKNIAEGLNISGRSVSGSIRKLISNGFVSKMGENPVTYQLTEVGVAKDLTNI